jgi:hypothetical protein
MGLMSNWFYKTPHEWRLLLQKGRTFEAIHECPLEICPLFKERLKENMTSGVEGDNRCRKRRRDRDYVYRQISNQEG